MSDDKDLEKAREIAGEIFGTTVEHITKAPEFCGRG